MSSYGGPRLLPTSQICRVNFVLRASTLQLNVLLRVLTYENVIFGHRQGPTFELSRCILVVKTKLRCSAE